MSSTPTPRIEGLDVLVDLPADSTIDGPGSASRALIFDHTTGAEYQSFGFSEDIVGLSRMAIRFPLPSALFDAKRRQLSIASSSWQGSLHFELFPRSESGDALGFSDDTGPHSASVVGKLEYFDGEIIRGWAYDSREAGNRMSIEVFIDNVRFTTVSADERRQELVKSGIGDGRCGFFKIMPASVLDGHRHVIACVTAGDRVLIEDGLLEVDLTSLRSFVIKEIFWRINRVESLLE